jgi:hypothetical protein
MALLAGRISMKKIHKAADEVKQVAEQAAPPEVKQEATTPTASEQTASAQVANTKVASAGQSSAPATKPKGKAHGQTGPKSIAGKNRVRWNAMVDGATAKSSVLPFEDEKLYRRHIKEVEKALCPVNYVEEQMVREYAEGLWRIIRHEKRGAYEREEILSRLTPASAAQMLGLEEVYVNCAPDWLIDSKHRVAKHDETLAQEVLEQYTHLLKNAKGIANFNLVWRQYPLLFELCGAWLLEQYPNATALFTNTGKDINLAWQQNPQKLLSVIEQFAHQIYFVAHFSSFKPKVRIWMETWYFLQRVELHRLERGEQLLLKERNYTYSLLERLGRFRKSNGFLSNLPGGFSAMGQESAEVENKMRH